MYYGGERWFDSRPDRIEGRFLTPVEWWKSWSRQWKGKWKLNRVLPERPIGEKTYNTAICAIFKDEGPYLKEWVEHHLKIGTDHIYMYNNESSDNYASILKPYIDGGRVTLIDWPYAHAQLEAYRDCLDRYQTECKWIGFIDLDEFIVLTGYDSLYAFLQRFEADRPAVLLNWNMMGSSGFVDRDLNIPVTEAFHACNPTMHVNGKCFFNTRYDCVTSNTGDGSFHHRTYGRVGDTILPPVNCFDRVTSRRINLADSPHFPVYINHYCVKSLREYEQRMRKTDVFFEVNNHNMEYFHRYNDNCTAEDYALSPRPAADRES